MFRSLARVVLHLGRFSPETDPAEWLDAHIAEAVRSRINDDLLALRGEGDYKVDPWNEKRCRWAIQVLKVQPRDALAACAHFNLGPREERRAFWCVFMEGKPLREAAREFGGNVELCRESIARVLGRIGVSFRPLPETAEWSGGRDV